MPLLDAATAAAVVGVSTTRLRLFLAREGRAIVAPSVQGRQRPIPDSALLPITLTFLLARDLGAPLSAACPLALRILEQAEPLRSSPGLEGKAAGIPPLVPLSPTIALQVDLPTLRAHLRSAIAERLETAPDRPRRGRPSK